VRAGLLMAFIALVWQGYELLRNSAVLPPDDFIEYWAAGRLNVTGQDPYAPAALLALETAAGRVTDQAVMMWNPPWTLALVMPLGLLPARPAQLLWLLLNFVAILYSADCLWRLYGGRTDRRWIAWLLGIGYVPTIFVLRSGQIGPALLLGLTGFLVFERAERDFWAGAATALVAIKPHLFILFWIALALWICFRRRWKVLAGAVAAALVATGLALLPNSHVLHEYLLAARTHPPEQWVSPTMGSLLRYAFGEKRFWLQFAPMVLGLGFFVPYWLQNGRKWNWRQHAPLLTLVCFVTAPYGAWPFDLVVLLPGVMQIAARLHSSSLIHTSEQSPSLARLVLVAAYAATNLAALGMNLAHASSFWFIWFSPAMLVLYLAADRPGIQQTRFAGY
jgi:hypothetical protein